MRRHHLLLQLLLLLLPLLVHLRTYVDQVRLEVITNTTSCSTSCGVGIQTETLCEVEDTRTALERNEKEHKLAMVSKKCRVRKVKCMESWRCGISTLSATVGQRVVFNCMEEASSIGKFSWRVSWRFARGVISMDNALFVPQEAPEVERLTLDPIMEGDAGTYRCDVKDATYRRVKREYWGVRVLPDGIVNLDYESAEARWDHELHPRNKTASFFRGMISISTILAIVLTVLVGFYLMKKRTQGR